MRTAEETAIGSTVIALMRGVLYRETAQDLWPMLERHSSALRDHFRVIGVEVMIDDDEGYAYLRSEEAVEGEEPLPRLIKRRSLTYHASLLLVLLRKRLVEFETAGSDGRLVLSREQLVTLLRVFLAGGSDEIRVVERADAIIGQVEDLGFLRELRTEPGRFEVRRILKAYVDAQTLADFAARLDAYAAASHHE